MADESLFYRLRDLTTLSIDELRAYALHCRAVIEAGQETLLRLEGSLAILSANRRKDALLAYGGFGLAVVGIATTALLTPLGFLTLIGGAMALAGADSAISRAMNRQQLLLEQRDLRRSVAFCRQEQMRIADELLRRRPDSGDQ